MAQAAIGTVPLGKHNVSLDELHQVAYYNYEVEPNKACMTTLAEQRRPKGDPLEVKHEIPSVQDGAAVLAPSAVRALMLLRVSNSLEGRSGLRVEVVQFLVDLLNNRITPELAVFEDERNTLAQLAGYLTGSAQHTKCLYKGEPAVFADALAAAGDLKAPGLTKDEYLTVTHALSASTAVFALSTRAAAVLMDGADAVAALSLEAIQAFTKPFDAVNYDINRPHAGGKSVAGNLRLMLNASERINRSKRKVQDPACFTAIAHYHGPAREVLPCATQAAKKELKSAESQRFSTHFKDASGHHPQPVISWANALVNALAVVASGSQQRVSALLAGAKDYGLPAGLAAPKTKGQADADAEVANRDIGLQKHCEVAAERIKALHAVALHAMQFSTTLQHHRGLTVALALAQAVQTLHQVVSLEAFVANQALTIDDDAALFTAVKTQAKKLKKSQEYQDKMTKDAADATARGDAKAAEKILKKLEKVQNKQKVSDPKGLTLGKGVTTLRKLLGMEAAKSAEEADATLASVAAKLDPSSVSEVTLQDSLARLLTNTGQSMSRPKVPKGTRDATPQQMTIRDKAFKIIKGVFQAHGAVGIDTPVFEQRETLMGKYGEDSKLIYDLADQGGEILSLRYDLTVPFARYIASNQLDQIKRYHIARVYRRDNPVMTKGRFREFYQCDFDVAGDYGSPMVADSEVLMVLTQILDKLDIGPYKVKLNHRKLLDSLMDICGVPSDKFRPICSAIDKLDKAPWEEVKREMVAEKGLAEEVADRLGKYVTMDPGHPNDMLAKLMADEQFSQHKLAQEAFTELGLLFQYLTAFGCIDKISFDMSLARGLDYYTGVIYEAMLTQGTKVGSIAAGGRYDKLVGMFCSKHVPAVGVSVGIERIFTIMEKLEMAKGSIRSTATEVMVCSAGKGNNAPLEARMQLCADLWRVGVKAEFDFKPVPKAAKQMQYADAEQIPFTVWMSEEGLKKGQVMVKDMSLGEEGEQVPVKREDIAQYMLKVLGPRD